MRQDNLRVLHVSRFFHPHVGGTENHIADLADYVSAHGITSAVLTSTRKLYATGPDPRIPVYRLPVVGPDWFPVPRAGARTVRDLVGGSDVVHVHDLRFALELVTATALERDVPLVLSSHGLVFHTERLRLLKNVAWKTYYRALLSRFSVVLCVSETDAALCRRAGMTRNVRVLPNPVRTRPFENARPSQPRTGALLYFGRLAPNKGVERLASIMEIAPTGWTLTIAGRGDEAYARRLRRTFEPLGRRFGFVEDVSDSELPSLVANSDCVVLPSRSEGFGLTLVEAMATGVPVVASDIPTYREIAGGTSVQLVDFDRPRQCVDRIQDVMARWDRASAHDRAVGFSWERRGHDFVRLYRSLVR